MSVVSVVPKPSREYAKFFLIGKEKVAIFPVHGQIKKENLSMRNVARVDDASQVSNSIEQWRPVQTVQHVAPFEQTVIYPVQILKTSAINPGSP